MEKHQANFKAFIDGANLPPAALRFLAIDIAIVVTPNADRYAEVLDRTQEWSRGRSDGIRFHLRRTDESPRMVAILPRPPSAALEDHLAKLLMETLIADVKVGERPDAIMFQMLANMPSAPTVYLSQVARIAYERKNSVINTETQNDLYLP